MDCSDFDDYQEFDYLNLGYLASSSSKDLRCSTLDSRSKDQGSSLECPKVLEAIHFEYLMSLHQACHSKHFTKVILDLVDLEFLTENWQGPT